MDVDEACMTAAGDVGEAIAIDDVADFAREVEESEVGLRLLVRLALAFLLGQLLSLFVPGSEYSAKMREPFSAIHLLAGPWILWSFVGLLVFNRLFDTLLDFLVPGHVGEHDEALDKEVRTC